jgi:RNA-directed DNA polymerase
MSGDVQVQFCEQRWGRFPALTHRNIYLRSKAAAQRELTSLQNYLTRKLKLKVNEKKSQANHVSKGVFLGYTISGGGILKASKESIKRLQQNIRQATKRKGGIAIKEVINRVNERVMGWKGYFQLDKRKQIYQELDSWIKHRLRCYKLIQRKKGKTIVKRLEALGVKEEEASKIASSGKGRWRLSATRALHESMNNQRFKDQGLVSLTN